MGVRGEIIRAAEGYLGVPYKGIYQGTGPEDGGFTCSGFTWRCYADAGIDIPICQGIHSYYTGSYNGWDTQAGWLLSHGHCTEDPDELEVGDLVFYSPVGDMERTGHVAIYYGGGWVVHANGAPVSIDPIEAGGNFVGGGWPLEELPDDDPGRVPSFDGEAEVTFPTGVNIRDLPSTLSGDVVGEYDPGDGCTIYGIVLSEGRLWGRYTGASSGKERYVALGVLDLAEVQ